MRLVFTPVSALRRALLPSACALALSAGASATSSLAATPTGTTGVGLKADAAATLEQCVTAVSQSERSATFDGEMTAVPGTAKMEIRIELLERMAHEATFHVVSFPGLAVWSVSAPKVKVYKYLNKVTNLAAPAVYRGAVRFRWLGPRGHVIKSLELRTPRCVEPASPSTPSGSSTPAASSTPAGTNAQLADGAELLATPPASS